jgi:hypothetical protein
MNLLWNKSSIFESIRDIENTNNITIKNNI